MKSLAVLMLAVLCGQGWAFSPAQQLAQTLHDNYPPLKYIRPLEDSSHALDLQFNYMLTHIESFCEENAVLTIHGWYKMIWHDDYMTWDSNATGINNLRVANDQIWIPDIRSYQALHEEVTDNTLAVAQSTGSMVYVPLVSHTVQCERTEEDYAYTCRLKVGSWAMDKDLINLTIPEGEDPVDTDFFHAHPKWKLVSATGEIIEKTYDCCADSIYQNLQMDFVVSRV